jgi:hypothetical protein
VTDPAPGNTNAWFGLPGASDSEKLYVHFNPASLRVSMTNQFGEDPPEQHARATTVKLDVELLFDTTETGDDVRGVTLKLRDLATATGTGKKKDKSSAKSAKEEANLSLPKVVFHWGTADYVGIIESLTETLDYWSSDGVPLRSTVQVSMKGASADFLAFSAKAAAYATRTDPAPAPVTVLPAPAPPPTGKGATDTATQAGDPGAGRALAALNGMENMRAGAGMAVAAGASVNLSAAAGFQMSGGISAGASIGFGMGVSAGASASAGIGASVGVGMAAGMGGGIGAGIGGGIGMSAGAGFSAGAGSSAGASAGAGFSGGASASAGFGAGASFGMGSTMDAGGMIGAGAGVSMSAGLGGSSDGGFFSSATTSVTGFDGVTETNRSSSFTGLDGVTTSQSSTSFSSSGVPASLGAFAGLGVSKTTGWSSSYRPEQLLPPAPPSVGPNASFDRSGRLVAGSGVVAESYSYSNVTFY